MANCKHSTLHFENGGLYLVCGLCNRAWVAIKDKGNPGQPDFDAMFSMLQPYDERNDPFYIKPPPTPIKPK